MLDNPYKLILDVNRCIGIMMVFHQFLDHLLELRYDGLTKRGRVRLIDNQIGAMIFDVRHFLEETRIYLEQLSYQELTYPFELHNGPAYRIIAVDDGMFQRFWRDDVETIENAVGISEQSSIVEWSEFGHPVRFPKESHLILIPQSEKEYGGAVVTRDSQGCFFRFGVSPNGEYLKDPMEGWREMKVADNEIKITCHPIDNPGEQQIAGA